MWREKEGEGVGERGGETPDSGRIIFVLLLAGLTLQAWTMGFPEYPSQITSIIWS